MGAPKLSKRQEAILKFIRGFSQEYGYPPTIREIGRACDISSTSVVNYNLDKLERAGMLERRREVSRGLRLAGALRESSDIVRVPLVGRIVASEPMPVPGSDFAYFGADAAIDLTREIVGGSGEGLFALEVQGDSMIDAMIHDGDVVVMRPHQDVQDGDLVAVWITDREETTLKRIYRDGDRIRLQPANPTMKPIYIDDPSVVQVQGRVVAVIRQLRS